MLTTCIFVEVCAKRRKEEALDEFAPCVGHFEAFYPTPLFPGGGGTTKDPIANSKSLKETLCHFNWMKSSKPLSSPLLAPPPSKLTCTYTSSPCFTWLPPKCLRDHSWSLLQLYKGVGLSWVLEFIRGSSEVLGGPPSP